MRGATGSSSRCVGSMPLTFSRFCQPNGGEMTTLTEAHAGANLGELVCSNSLRSDLLSAPAGLLKAEMRLLDSLIIRCADRHRVPATGEQTRTVNLLRLRLVSN